MVLHCITFDIQRLINLFEFLDELFIAQTRVSGVIFTQCQRATDGQTDKRTNNPTVANTGLCIASYADAL